MNSILIIGYGSIGRRHVANLLRFTNMNNLSDAENILNVASSMKKSSLLKKPIKI
jgi:lactate dehydrogenase-like 2-hydroxyacid dehydrogenase|tara:strand:- start:492 stop:656 length:165 start_codon:yes stop_codon:yes gene_type:complete